MITDVIQLGVPVAGRYSARFFQTAGQNLSLSNVRTAICDLHPQFAHEGNLLSIDGMLFSEIDLIVAGSTAFDEYLIPIWQILNENRLGWPNREYITKLLRNCIGIIHFDTIWPDDLPAQRIVFDRLDLIWSTLLDTTDGMVLVDDGWFHFGDSA